MAKIQRQYDFETKVGKIISPSEVDAELDALVTAHNNQDDELIAHYSKQADETSSDTNKDKHVSNKQLKDIKADVETNRVNVLVEKTRNDSQDTQISGALSRISLTEADIAVHKGDISAIKQVNASQDTQLNELRGMIPYSPNIIGFIDRDGSGKVWVITVDGEAIDTVSVGEYVGNPSQIVLDSTNIIVRQTPSWIVPTLTGATQDGTEPIQYTKLDNGDTDICGLCTINQSTPQNLFTLPVGFRPKRSRVFVGRVGTHPSAAEVILNVSSTGIVSTQEAVNGTLYVNIRFRAEQ